MLMWLDQNGNKLHLVFFNFFHSATLNSRVLLNAFFLSKFKISFARNTDNYWCTICILVRFPNPLATGAADWGIWQYAYMPILADISTSIGMPGCSFPAAGQCAPRCGLVCLQWKEIFRRRGHLSTFMGNVSARGEEYPTLLGGPSLHTHASFLHQKGTSWMGS